jgi:hypothetical protein
MHKSFTSIEGVPLKFIRVHTVLRTYRFLIGMLPKVDELRGRELLIGRTEEE